MKQKSSESKPNSTRVALSQSEVHLILQARSVATYQQAFMARGPPGSLASKNAREFATQLKQFKPFETTAPSAPGVCASVRD